MCEEKRNATYQKVEFVLHFEHLLTHLTDIPECELARIVGGLEPQRNVLELGLETVDLLVKSGHFALRRALERRDARLIGLTLSSQILLCSR